MASSQAGAERSVTPPAEFEPNSLLAILCIGVSDEALSLVISAHGVVVVQKVSSDTVELGWDDRRSVEEMMRELSVEKKVFCHLEANYLYHLL